MLCICFFASACGEESAIFNENESESIVNIEATNDRNPDEIKLDIYHKYKESVETFKSENNFNTRYGLAHIDEDGIPELIYNVADGKYQVYTYDGKILVYSGAFKSKNGVFTYDGKLFATTSTPDYDVHAKISIDETHKIYDIGYPYMTKTKTSDGGYVYTYNQEEINEVAYNDISGKMEELLTYLEIILK